MKKYSQHTSAIIWSYLALQSLSLLLELISQIMDRYRYYHQDEQQQQQQSFWHLDSQMSSMFIFLINFLLNFSLFIQSFISDPEADKIMKITIDEKKVKVFVFLTKKIVIFRKSLSL